ncbi:MAG: hypothetical protein WKG07_49805 [Hymenobacter sp.]
MLETGYFRPRSLRRPATATPCGRASWCTCALTLAPGPVLAPRVFVDAFALPPAAPPSP